MSLHPPGMLASCGAVPSIRGPSSSLLVRRSPAGALRPGRARGWAARVLRDREPDSGAIANCCRSSPAKCPSRSAKASRRCCTRRGLAPSSACRGCTSRTSRPIPPTRSRRAGSPPPSRGRGTRRAHRLGADGRQRRVRHGGVCGTAGLEAHVFLPRDVKRAFVRECVLGASVNWSTASSPTPAASPPSGAAARGWYDVSTLKEPYRLEGKKTMAFELAEQLDWRCPTGLLSDRRRHGPDRHVEGLRGTGRPRLDRSRPPADDLGAGRRLRAHRAGVQERRRAGAGVGTRHTIADGLRVPRAVGDFLMLRAIRESGGDALAVDDRDGGRDARAGTARGDQRRAGSGHGPRRARRLVDPAGSGPTSWSCCSTPEAR